MFKHPKDEAGEENKPEEQSKPITEKKFAEDTVGLEKDVSHNTIQEMLEKNLKWSQIIYEQNRKINSKLLWAAIANWLRLAVLLVLIILPIWLLPPLIRDLQVKYEQLFSTSTGRSATIEDYLNVLPLVLPLNEQQINQFKAMVGDKK